MFSPNIVHSLHKDTRSSMNCDGTRIKSTKLQFEPDISLDCSDTSISSEDSSVATPVAEYNDTITTDKVCKNLSPKRQNSLSKIKKQIFSERRIQRQPNASPVAFEELEDSCFMENVLDALMEKGANKAARGNFRGAVNSLNDALTVQRNYFDREEKVVKTGLILNKIGIALSLSGIDYECMAINSFEKSLEIIQESKLGPGDENAADAANNMWILLHNVRDRCLEGNDQYQCYRGL